MKTTLVSYTTPAKELQENCIETPEYLIAYCARVSNPNNQYNKDTADKLLAFLRRNKHWSPFEMVDVTMEVVTTRDIARQMLRHRSFCFQEFSQRYAKVLDYELSEARLQDHKNRQNSLPVVDEELQEWWIQEQKKVLDVSIGVYTRALDKGIAKEVARKVLPEGLMQSTLYMKGSLRSWIHYCELRAANGTQKEHMEVAREIAKVISELFPSVHINTEGNSQND